MTGFALINTHIEIANIVWEARSVNHKSLDVKLRSNLSLAVIENILKKQVSQFFTRGSIGLTLTINYHNHSNAPKINEEYLKQVLALSQQLQRDYKLEQPSIAGLLALDGVLEKSHNNTIMLEDEDLKTAILTSFTEVLEALKVARQREGENLQKILLHQVDTIENLTKQARNDPARSIEAIEAWLEKKVSSLMKTNVSLDPQRLHMEAVLLATKADILEELDRLDGHIAAAIQLLHRQEPVGRRLDFLAQEFNREASTLCSKANSSSLSATGLALKTVIDQWREQIQNIE